MAHKDIAFDVHITCNKKLIFDKYINELGIYFRMDLVLHVKHFFNYLHCRGCAVH